MRPLGFAKKKLSMMPVSRRLEKRSSWCRAVLVAVLLAAARPTFAYNHDQHLGIVALAYKAMVAASLELDCELQLGLRTFVTDYCSGDLNGCEAAWNELLVDVERGIRFLRGIDSSLAPPRENCPDPRAGGNTLGEVRLAVDRYYNREDPDDRSFCGLPAFDPGQCSIPAGLCDPGSIYRYFAPTDHTGDVLGYWATEPDDDGSVSALGVKPTSALGLGGLNDLTSDYLEKGATALLIPVVCLVHFFQEGDLDCLDQARSLANDAIPLDELHSLVPVVGALRDADAYAGLWHFQQNVPGASNECDDRQGILYEEAGPRLVPDAVDLGIVIVGDALGLTLNYDESTGPTRFNITDPGDGDQPSCQRDRTEWEFQTLGHTTFSPIDNLALYGWKRFAEAPSARELGWPLHAIGDAVAPHHVTGTTGWGHRPFEDAAEIYWREILYMDRSAAQEQNFQYEQLRRILGWGLHFSRHIARLRAERPTGAAHNAIPVRAFITQVASETMAITTDPETGAPGWPFDPRLSVPYIFDAALKTQILTVTYGSTDSIDRMRVLIERGAGAALAFLSQTWRVAGETPVPDVPRCGTDGQFQCGPYSTCDEGCCYPSLGGL